MRYVDAEIVMRLVEAFNAEPSGTTDNQLAALRALDHATIYEIAEPVEPTDMTANRKVLGDEMLPPQVRLEARLAAACRTIDALDKFSLFSISFVAEQRRFLQELKDSRGAMGRAHRGETGI